MKLSIRNILFFNSLKISKIVMLLLNNLLCNYSVFGFDLE
jgi:hypothetical protein